MPQIEAVEHTVSGLQVKEARDQPEDKSGLRLCQFQPPHKAVVVNILRHQDTHLLGNGARPTTNKGTDSTHASSSATVST
jgi:hypothetical protein